MFALILCTYMLIFTSFFFIEIHESHEKGTPFSDEYTELFAVLGVMMVSTPFSLLIAWSFAGWIMKPLRQVLQTAEKIRQGNLENRIPPMPNQDELALLAQTVNDAFDQYASAVKRLENFSSDASHQLRTPLAVIRTSAEVSLQSDRTAADYRETLGDILEQTGKLNQTIDQLLLLSRMDASVQTAFKPVNLTSLLQTSCAEAASFLAERRVKLDFAFDRPSFSVRGDAILLKEVFNNLLNNSLAVLKDEGIIAIRVLTRGDNSVEWIVEDSGPGIAQDEMVRIFDRFYRGRDARHAGSGLGLAIVRQIIHLHGGSINAGRSASLGGASFSIVLPLG